jgi:hypothetical protein
MANHDRNIVEHFINQPSGKSRPLLVKSFRNPYQAMFWKTTAASAEGAYTNQRAFEALLGVLRLVVKCKVRTRAETRQVAM